MQKVLHHLLGKPIICYILDSIEHFSPEEVIVVVSPDGEEPIRSALGNETKKYVIQPEAKGTADAVKLCRAEVSTRRMIVLCGDVPLIRPQTLSSMIALHQSRGAAATLLTTELPDPTGYGRVIRNSDGTVMKIVEHKDATASEKAVREMNSGTYVFETELLFEMLDKVQPSQTTGEYYLTDVVAMMVASGRRVEALKIDDRTEVMGINDQAALKALENILKERILDEWMRMGVGVENSQQVSIEGNIKVSPGARLTGSVALKGTTSIGIASSIGPYVQMEDTVVEGSNCIKGSRSRKYSS